MLLHNTTSKPNVLMKQPIANPFYALIVVLGFIMIPMMAITFMVIWIDYVFEAAGL